MGRTTDNISPPGPNDGRPRTRAPALGPDTSGYSAESSRTPSAKDQASQHALDAVAMLAQDSAILSAASLPHVVSGASAQTRASGRVGNGDPLRRRADGLGGGGVGARLAPSPGRKQLDAIDEALLQARGEDLRTIYLCHAVIACLISTPVDVDQVELLFTSLLIQATRAMSAAGTQRTGSFDRSPALRSSLPPHTPTASVTTAEADQQTVASHGAQAGRRPNATSLRRGRRFRAKLPHTTDRAGFVARRRLDRRRPRA